MTLKLFFSCQNTNSQMCGENHETVVVCCHLSTWLWWEPQNCGSPMSLETRRRRIEVDSWSHAWEAESRSEEVVGCNVWFPREEPRWCLNESSHLKSTSEKGLVNRTYIRSWVANLCLHSKSHNGAWAPAVNKQQSPYISFATYKQVL